MLYRYSTAADSPHADGDDDRCSGSLHAPAIFDVDKLRSQLHRHFSSSATRSLRYSWWYPLLRVCPSSVHTLWLSAKRCSNSRRSRPSVFIIKVPFRAPDAYTCTQMLSQPSSSLNLGLGLSALGRPSTMPTHKSHKNPKSHKSHKSGRSLSPPSGSSTSGSIHRSATPEHFSSSACSSSYTHGLSQPHSRIHQNDGHENADLEVDPLDYHECSDPACQANLDAYFLHRIETYTPMLQMMRARQRRKAGVVDDSEPVVVVTNWQHVEHYPSEWVARFREVVRRSLHPFPIYIETFGTDEQTEDQLMEVIEDVKHSSHFFAMLREKAVDCGGVGKSLMSGSSLDDVDGIAPLSSPRKSPSAMAFKWRAAARAYWPLILVAFLLVCLIVFRHFLAPSPAPDVVEGGDVMSAAEGSGDYSQHGTLSSAAGGYAGNSDYYVLRYEGGYQPQPPDDSLL